MVCVPLIGDDDQKGALKLIFQLLCVQPKKGDGDLSYLFSEYEVIIIMLVTRYSVFKPCIIM